MPPAPDPSQVRLVFNGADVPCEERHLSGALSRLRRCAEGAYSADAAAAVLKDVEPHLSDGSQMHRALLASKRDHRHTWMLTEAINDALKEVRRHSDLYGARYCACLAAAWRTYAERVEAALAKTVVPASHSVVWATQVGDRVLDQRQGLVTSETLLRAAGVTAWGYDGGLADLSLRRHRRLRCQVRIGHDDHGRVRVEMLWGAARAGRHVTMTALDPVESRVAVMLRHGVGPARPDAAAWILATDCAPLMRLLHGRIVRHAGGPGVPAACAELLDVGFLNLPPAAQEAAVLLSEDWKGSFAELIDSAHTVMAAA